MLTPDDSVPLWWAKVDGLLFDIGDTLVPATRLQHETLYALASALEARASVPSARRFIETYLRVDARPELDELPDLNHLYSDRRILADTYAALDLATSPEEIERVLAEYRAELRRRLVPDDEWRITLDALRAHGLRLGIVSNGTTIEQHDQLATLGIETAFDPILISQAVGIRKPSPDIFLLAAKQWGLPPAAVAVVGDRPDWDVAAAQRAGMRSILTVQFADHRASGFSDRVPDLVIHGPRDLLRLVGKQ